MRPQKEILLMAKKGQPLKLREIFSLNTKHLSPKLHELTQGKGTGSMKIFDILLFSENADNALNHDILIDLRKLKDEIFTTLRLDAITMLTKEVLNKYGKKKLEKEEYDSILHINYFQNIITRPPESEF